MKTILISGLTMLLPALAQTPDDLITQLTIDRPGSAGQRLYFGRAGAIVKNAPYSADAVTETMQSLTDGNRIVQRTSEKLYRDSDGRERREESVLATGALSQAEMPRLITISDPVDSVSYTLNPAQRTALRRSGSGGGLITLVAAQEAVGNFVASRQAGFRLSGPSEQEDLGMKNIEGVIARGTRTTETIPAGQIGNQLPIKIVDEVWHSSELQMDVLTTHTDPRSGEVTYKLMNISRTNPPRSLFEPPADYTVTGPATGGGRSGPATTTPGAGRGGRGGARGPQE